MFEFNLISSSIGIIIFCIYILLRLIFRNYSRFKPATISFSHLGTFHQNHLAWRVKFYWIIPALRIIAIILLLIAFARPRKGQEMIKAAREGVAIQAVIDHSSSMTQPMLYQGQELTRLQVVKKVFQKFIQGDHQKLKGRPSDMIALTSFAGFVEENAPLTLDHENLVNFVEAIQPATKIEDGTMIGDGIYHAALRLVSADEFLRRISQQNNSYKIQAKIIILLTDGQQTQGGFDPIKAAEFAQKNQIKIYTIAIVDDQNYKHQNSLLGQFFSLQGRTLDTSLLKEIAKITGGKFAKANSGEQLIQIYQNIDHLEKTKFEEHFTIYHEHFIWFLTLGFICLILEIVLAHTILRRIP